MVELPSTLTLHCIMGFREENKQGDLLCEIYEGDVIVALLDEEVEEYISTDTQGRQFVPAAVNSDGDIVLDESFELVNEGKE